MPDAAARLIADIETLCRDVAVDLASERYLDALRAIQVALRDPLRIAIVGSVSAGKSTLVNTLLRRTVAPVGASDTTRVVTWYRYDSHERVEAHLYDGSVRTVALTASGEVPSGLDVPINDVRDLHVYLSHDVLRSTVIIDTPGIDSVGSSAQERTESLLGMRADPGRSTAGAIEAADAVIYVFSHYRKTDADFLQELAGAAARTRSSTMNVIGVLSKVDRLVDPGVDPWPTASRVAARASAELAASLLDVVPVIGLLGEAARAGRVGEADGAALRTLAQHGSATVADLVSTTHGFLNADSTGVDRDTRARLLALLDARGVVIGTEIAVQARDLDAMLARWEQESNVTEIERLLEARFTRRAELLKIHSALRDLERLSYTSEPGPEGAVLRSLRHPLETLGLDSALHDLRVFDFASQPATRQLAPPLLEDLRRLSSVEDHLRVGLARGTSPAEIAASAAASAARWATVCNDTVTDPGLRRGAWDVKHAFELIWERQQP